MTAIGQGRLDSDILLLYCCAIGWSQDVAQAVFSATNSRGGEKKIES